MTSALWSFVGYVVALIVMAIPIGGLFLLTRTRAWRRRKQIRRAGWAPWWYVGGQPDVLEEVQVDSEGEND